MRTSTGVVKTNVAIVGAGLGGIGLGLRLQMEGEASFLIIDKADGVGGTWRANTYPGCACDIPGHLYWYDLATVPAGEQPDWERVYPTQREILANIEVLVRRRGLERHLRLNTELIEARWQDHAWHLRTRTGETIVAAMLVSAMGQLSRPLVPAIEGQDDFAGTAFHSARWDHAIDLRGKRVASVGSAASAVQFVPAIAPAVRRLTVFQRSPEYLLPRLDRAYTAEERQQFRDPKVREASRENCYQWQESLYRAFREDATASDAKGFRDTARAHLEASVRGPELREKLWPAYPFGCKRPLMCDDYYPALERDNVELVTDPIVRIEPRGVVTREGKRYPADVIVYATGFDSQSFFGPIEIIGRAGTLTDAWRERVTTYNGVMVAGFPNFFMLYGPYSGLGHNSILLMMEEQTRFVLETRRALRAGGYRVADVVPHAMEASTTELATKVAGHVWGHGCATWWKGARGGVTTNWPGDVEDYRRRLRFDPTAVTLSVPDRDRRRTHSSHVLDHRF